MKDRNSKPKVLVIMPTFNGEKYLENQINSILSQKGVHVRIFAHDDASSDRTPDILKLHMSNTFQVTFGNQNLGTSESLKQLLSEVEQDEYLAFADQDDCWADTHLIEGIRKLSSKPQSEFNLYFPRYIFIDQNGLEIGFRAARQTIGLPNALVENPAIGCGIILNPAAAQKCREIVFVSTLQMDKQLYFFASALGNVLQGEASSVFYRLHPDNQIGLGRKTRNTSISKLISQLKNDQHGLETLFEINLNLLESVRIKCLRRHFDALNSNWLIRFIYSFSPVFRREKKLDQLIFKVLCALGFLK